MTYAGLAKVAVATIGHPNAAVLYAKLPNVAVTVTGLLNAAVTYTRLAIAAVMLTAFAFATDTHIAHYPAVRFTELAHAANSISVLAHAVVTSRNYEHCKHSQTPQSGLGTRNRSAAVTNTGHANAAVTTTWLPKAVLVYTVLTSTAFAIIGL